MEPIDALHSIADKVFHQRIVPFVGAGYSPGPGWDDLIARINARFFADRMGDAGEVLELPYRVELERRGSRSAITEIIRELYGPNAYTGRTPYYDSLAQLPLRTFVTTNFDPFLERSLNARAISKDADVSLWNPHDRTVIKMHGSSDGSVVLTERDYLEYETRFPALSKLTFALFLTQSLLFLGFSFRDANVRMLFSKVRQLLELNHNESYYVGFCVDAKYRDYLESGFNLVVLDVADLHPASGTAFREAIRADHANLDDIRESATLHFLQQLGEMTCPAVLNDKHGRERLIIRETERFARMLPPRRRKGVNPPLHADNRSIVRIRATIGPYGVPESPAEVERIWGPELATLLIRRRSQMIDMSQKTDIYMILTPAPSFQQARDYPSESALLRLAAIHKCVQEHPSLIPVTEVTPTGLSTHVFGDSVAVQSVNSGADDRRLYDGAYAITDPRGVSAAIAHFDAAFRHLSNLPGDTQLPLQNPLQREVIRKTFLEQIEALMTSVGGVSTTA